MGSTMHEGQSMKRRLKDVGDILSFAVGIWFFLPWMAWDILRDE